MTAPRVPRHEAIRASAGSGKTFVLSQRFIELLARGAPVERITALTFSRKADTRRKTVDLNRELIQGKKVQKLILS